jgi:hypothetical protein
MSINYEAPHCATSSILVILSLLGRNILLRNLNTAQVNNFPTFIVCFSVPLETMDRGSTVFTVPYYDQAQREPCCNELKRVFVFQKELLSYTGGRGKCITSSPVTWGWGNSSSTQQTYNECRHGSCRGKLIYKMFRAQLIESDTTCRVILYYCDENCDVCVFVLISVSAI